MTKNLLPGERIESRILYLRGQKVIIDRDLAKLYGVTTKVLNQSVKRNQDRFPADFMFKLTEFEKDKVVTNCNHLQNLKFSAQLPSAFTEHGVAMLSSVLRSPKAIEVNIAIIRAFARLRNHAISYEGLARKIAELENKYDTKIADIFKLLDRLIAKEPPSPTNKEIGFQA